MGHFFCPLCCGRSFSNRRSLKYHLLTSETNLSCPECARRFGSIVELADHLDLDFCDQVVVAISIPQEKDVNIVGDLSVKSKQPKVHLSNRISGSLVEKIHQHVKPYPNKQRDIPQPHAANCENFIVSSDGIPTAVVDYEVVVTDKVDPSYDMESALAYKEEDDDEHFCNSCNCKVERVMEHINKFHPHEMVVFQNADVISTSLNDDANEVAVSNEVEDEDFRFSGGESPGVTLPCETCLTELPDVGLQENTKSNAEEVQNLPSTPSSLKKHQTNIKLHLNLHQSGSNKVTQKAKAKQKSPKIFDTVDKSYKVDPKTGIPYVRRIVHIEKFWESDSYKKFSLEDSEESDVGENEENITTGVEKMVETSIKNQAQEKKEDLKKNVISKVIQVPPKCKKPTIIQAHINQLLRSGALTTLKESMGDSIATPASNEDILKRLFNAANEHEDLESSETTIDGSKNETLPGKDEPTKEKEERKTIFKLISDPTSGDSFPVLICGKCKAEFGSADRFSEHKCKGPKVFLPTTCELCGIKCRSNRTLRIHLESHDPFSKTKKLFQKQVKKLLSKPVTCKHCNTEFTTEGGLKIHQKMHRPDNVEKVAEMNNKVEYRCDLCNMVCYSARTFRIHYQVHIGSQLAGTENETPSTGTISDLSLLTCRLCSETFISNEELKAHWKNHYLEGLKISDKPTTDAAEETMASDEKFFTCQQCGKRLSESLREVHEKMHGGESKFDCSICNKPFTSESNLTLHMMTHNSDIEFKCIHCQAKFIDASVLKAHIRTHTAVDRPYPCGFCGRRFSRPHEKVKHERIHTGEKPYECGVCGMRFRVGYCLRMHERIHTGVRPYSCEHCGKTFRARSGYKQHIRLHSDVRAFSCPFCPKTFKTVVQLAGHKKSHTKPFTCPDCGRRFATMYMVRAHVNTHSKKVDSLKYRCYICGASYGRDYALKDHIKTHGKNVPPPPPEKENDMELMSDVSNDS